MSRLIARLVGLGIGWSLVALLERVVLEVERRERAEDELVASYAAWCEAGRPACDCAGVPA